MGKNPDFEPKQKKSNYHIVYQKLSLISKFTSRPSRGVKRDGVTEGFLCPQNNPQSNCCRIFPTTTWKSLDTEIKAFSMTWEQAKQDARGDTLLKKLVRGHQNHDHVDKKLKQI